MALVGLGHVLHLGSAPTELDGGVAILLDGARCHHLHLIEVQDGDGNVRPIFFEKPGHPELFCN